MNFTNKHLIFKKNSMETLSNLANSIGFGSFKGMILYFSFLLFWVILGILIYKGQKK